MCFLPGTLALGVHFGMPQDHMRLAEDLLYTCYQTYAVHPTYLAPEISYFNEVCWIVITSYCLIARLFLLFMFAGRWR